MSDVSFAVLDLETTGLDPRRDKILEVGCVLVDENLKQIDHFHSYVNDIPTLMRLNDVKILAFADSTNFNEEDLNEQKHAKIVWDMHVQSGLLTDLSTAPYCRDHSTVEDMLTDWLYGHGCSTEDHTGQEPELCLLGSSIHYDTDFLALYMPDVLEHFNHRRFDASAFQVVSDRWIPTLVERRDKELRPLLKKKHRAISDCLDSLNMARFYIKQMGGPQL